MASSVRDLFADPLSPLYASGVMGVGAAPRQAQVDYAGAVSDVLASPYGIGLIQGETGTGKTFGYLVPALLDAARTGAVVMVSTNTLALQKQVFERTLPKAVAFVKAQTGKSLKVALRIGRRNFISVEAMRLAILALAAAGISREVLDLLRSIHAHLAAEPALAVRQEVSEIYGTRLREVGAPAYFFENLEIGQHPGDEDAYREMLAQCAGADVIVVNHALLATNLISFGRAMPYFEDRRSILVVDEADALPEMVKALLSRKLPLREIVALLRDMDLNISERKRSDRALKMLSDLFDEAAKAHSPHRSRVAPASVLPMGDPSLSALAGRFATGLGEVFSVVGSAFEEGRLGSVHPDDLKVAVSDMEAMRQSLTIMSAGVDPGQTCSLYWSPTRGWPGLHLDGGQPGDVISLLWRRDEMAPSALVFTSATLTGASGRINLRDFAASVGMTNGIYATCLVSAFAPASFGKMDFVVIDQRISPPVTVEDDDEESEHPTKSNPEIIEWWAAMVREAARAGGRILVLTPSHRDASSLFEAIGFVPGRMVLMDSRSAGPSVLSVFDADESAILVSAIRWTGLDMPGKIRHIVIPRFPLAPPDVVYDMLREVLMAARGVSGRKIRQRRFPISLANARRRMLQGVGRGIRVESDHVTVWVGDGRWPVPVDRKIHCPTLRERAWAASMVTAVPHRFARELDKALVFDPVNGVRTFAATLPPKRSAGRRSTIVAP